ncbi:MAG: hypothetical protein ABI162_07090 [Luteolibacter sp.]
MSQAKDPTRVVDGFASLEGGMDSARVPSLISPIHAHLLVNHTVRGGHLHTRPTLEQMDGIGLKGDWTNNGRFNGAFVYWDPAGIAPTKIVIAVGRTINTVDPVNHVESVLATGRADAYTWFCQAENYLIMQNGLDEPLIYDGNDVFTATEFDPQFPIPVGTIMSFGQGRLFVASKDRRNITAGDLIYGGSTQRAVILTMTVASDTLITTDGDHGLGIGETVTITGSTSVPDINGTYLVTDVPSPQSLRIGVALTSAGSGGYTLKALPGAASDLLRFSETTYLAEGGSFRLPFFMGQITGMVFPPVEDTATGQGDLLVAGDFGMASFQVSADRLTWKLIPFQRVVFREFGATSPTSFVTVNGDFFFRSNFGIRNYRNSRLAFYAHGYQPLSGELNDILDKEDPKLLDKVSAIQFDNRYLMTCLPAKDNPPSWPYYQGVVSLDFNAVSVNFGKTNSAYDGLWTGPKFLQLLSGRFNGEQRAFAITQGPYLTYSVALRLGIWEIKKDQGPDVSWKYDDRPEFGPTTRTAHPIQSVFESRGFNFSAPLNLKELLRGEIWFADVLDTVTVAMFFRSDQNPIWTPWVGLTMTADTCVYSGPHICPPLPVVHSKFGGYFPAINLPTPTQVADLQISRPVNFGHEFEVRIETTGSARLVKLILYALDKVESTSGHYPSNILTESISNCNSGFLDYKI